MRTINTFDVLDHLFEISHEDPVVIFKHSKNCGISAHVLQMMKEVDAELNVVVVQEARAISDAVAERTGFRHHTPQAFVIRGGRAVYHATHYAIDPEQIAEELAR